MLVGVKSIRCPKRRPFMEYIQEATLTQISDLSNQARQEYNKKVYTRNFDLSEQ